MPHENITPEKPASAICSPLQPSTTEQSLKNIKLGLSSTAAKDPAGLLDLPQELLDEIWGLLIPDPRVLPFIYWKASDRVMIAAESMTKTLAVLLHLCQNSRMFALKTYTLSFQNLQAPGKPLYVDWTRDTLCFMQGYFRMDQQRWLLHHRPGWICKVQNIIIVAQDHPERAMDFPFWVIPSLGSLKSLSYEISPAQPLSDINMNALKDEMASRIRRYLEVSGRRKGQQLEPTVDFRQGPLRPELKPWVHLLL